MLFSQTQLVLFLSQIWNQPFLQGAGGHVFLKGVHTSLCHCLLVVLDGYIRTGFHPLQSVSALGAIRDVYVMKVMLCYVYDENIRDVYVMKAIRDVYVMKDHCPLFLSVNWHFNLTEVIFSVFI